MDTDLGTAVALARMIRSRIRRLERDLLELRGLATQLLETVDTPETEEDTGNERNGTGTAVRTG